jgi:hypothetical protein
MKWPAWALSSLAKAESALYTLTKRIRKLGKVSLSFDRTHVVASSVS